jgi:hypothetical protein
MTICHNLTHGTDYGLLSLQISPYFYIGVFRLLSFVVLFLLFYEYKKYTTRTGQLSAMKFFLILPIYYDYLRLLILYSVTIGVLNVIPYNTLVNSFGIAGQLAGFHFFYEGLWLFLTQYGAGRRAFLGATAFGLLSALVSFIVFFAASIEIHKYDESHAFVYLMSYNVVYSLVYILSAVVPDNMFYKRPAMKWYAVVQGVYYAVWVLSVVAVFNGVDAGYCIAASNYILLDGILKPAVIFYTLSMDSAVSFV